MFPRFLTLCVVPQCCVVGPSLRIERVPEARRVGATLIDRFSPDKISYLHSYNILHAFSHHFLLLDQKARRDTATQFDRNKLSYLCSNCGFCSNRILLYFPICVC